MGVVVAVDTWLQRLVLVTVVAPTLTPAPVSVIRLSPVGPLLGTLAITVSCNVAAIFQIFLAVVVTKNGWSLTLGCDKF